VLRSRFRAALSSGLRTFRAVFDIRFLSIRHSSEDFSDVRVRGHVFRINLNPLSKCISLVQESPVTLPQSPRTFSALGPNHPTSKPELVFVLRNPRKSRIPRSTIFVSRTSRRIAAAVSKLPAAGSPHAAQNNLCVTTAGGSTSRRGEVTVARRGRLGQLTSKLSAFKRLTFQPRQRFGGLFQPRLCPENHPDSRIFQRCKRKRIDIVSHGVTILRSPPTSKDSTNRPGNLDDRKFVRVTGWPDRACLARMHGRGE